MTATNLQDRITPIPMKERQPDRLRADLVIVYSNKGDNPYPGLPEDLLEWSDDDQRWHTVTGFGDGWTHEQMIGHFTHWCYAPCVWPSSGHSWNHRPVLIRKIEGKHGAADHYVAQTYYLGWLTCSSTEKEEAEALTDSSGLCPLQRQRLQGGSGPCLSSLPPRIPTRIQTIAAGSLLGFWSGPHTLIPRSLAPKYSPS